MKKVWGSGLIILLVLVISLIAFAQDEMAPGGFNIEKIKHQKYLIKQVEDGKTNEGYLTMDVTPKETDKFDVKIDFKLGEQEFSNSFTTSKSDSENMFSKLFFSNPGTMAVIAPVLAVQLLLLPVTLMGGELKEGFKWSSKEGGEKTTIQVNLSEERFGKKAYWIEILKNDKIAVRMLMAKEGPLPFVVDIQDPEIIGEGQKSLYLELKEMTLN